MNFNRSCFLVIALISCSANAGDWPQILGPNRDGIAAGETISTKWPDGTPTTVWQRDAGSGFAGVAVVKNVAILFHRVRGDEVVEAMDAATGKVKWTSAVAGSYVPSFINDNGPRAVPLIHKDRIIVYGALGHLRCLDFASGREIWSNNTFKNFPRRRAGSEPAEGFFGIGSVPIVEAGKVIVNIGGGDGAGIVAFKLEDGTVAWKSTEDRASYSSPIAVTVNDVRHLIFATRFHVVSLDPKNGAERFRFEFGRPGPNVTAANPVVINNRLFITASYAFGAVFADIGGKAATERWSSDEILSSQYTTSIVDGDVLYGVHGRQDAGAADLVCINPVSQKTLWTKEGFGYATLIKAGDKLLAMKTDGTLVIVKASSEGYEELAQASLFDKTTRALPAISNGRLFVRDSSTLKCFQLTD